MFSVIIPTLNEQNNIKNAVKQFSLIKSKYNIEIIVSDSGSTDQTVDIAPLKEATSKSEENVSAATSKNKSVKNNSS